jgi:hypothetical protein
MAATTIHPIPGGKVPIYWKVAGTVFRSAFLLGLAFITARISLPDSLSSAVLAHLSAADYVRGAIGIMVCISLVVQLFRPPHDDHGYKAWSFIGLALIAVAIFIIAVHGAFPSLA